MSMEHLKQENILLNRALTALVETKKYRENNGNDETYYIMRRIAWRMAESTLNMIDGKPIIETSVLSLYSFRKRKPFNYPMWLQLLGFFAIGYMAIDLLFILF